MISQDNAYLQNQRASGPIINTISNSRTTKGAVGTGKNDFSSGLQGTFYQQ